MRWLKPEFFADPWFVRRPPLTRLVYVGLWCFADDAGRFVADVAVIHGQLAAMDGRKQVERALAELEEASRIVRWEANGLRYGLVPMFAIHQRIDKPQRSVIPLPPMDVRNAVELKLRSHPRWDARFEGNLQRMLHEDSTNDRGTSEEDSRKTPASHARARLDQGTKGPGDQGTEGGEETPTRKRYRVWVGIHARCGEVSFEKFAEILHENPGAPVDAILKRLRLELEGMEWPWKDRNAAMVLRNEREAMAGTGISGDKNAPPSAEELRARREGGGG